jgi:glutathione S-transferase
MVESMARELWPLGIHVPSSTSSGEMANMSSPEIVLHEWSISPYCGKVRKVLDFKGLPYRLEDYGGLRGAKVKGLSKVGKLPVLDYGEQRIQDSRAIAKALDARHPDPPLVPSSVDRHLVNLLEDWADESLYWYTGYLRLFDEEALDRAVALACAGKPAYEHVMFKLVFSRFRGRIETQGLGRYPAEVVLAKFEELMDSLAGRLEQNPWLCGGAPSIADIAVSAQLDEVLRTSRHAPMIRARTRLAEWLERCQFGRREAEAPS